MGVGNDLFDNAKSIRWILCPAENAFSCCGEIRAKIRELVPKDRLIRLALGPTVTVLAHDLFLDGYQAVDIGHVDISYERYLRGVRGRAGRVVIPGIHQRGERRQRRGGVFGPDIFEPDCRNCRSGTILGDRE